MAKTLDERNEIARKLMSAYRYQGITCRVHTSADLISIFNPAQIPVTPAAGEHLGLSNLGWTVYTGDEANALL